MVLRREPTHFVDGWSNADICLGEATSLNGRGISVRSEITIDLGALRRNVTTVLRALDGAELWAVVKADAYGHGAVDCADAALAAGARVLCVATVPEALVLRSELPAAPILVLGPVSSREIAQARTAD